jgi:rhodanese-related sulfurtransferase
MNIFIYGSLALTVGVASLAYYTFSGTNLITADQAKNLLKSKKVNHVIDVRTKAEWDLGHYKGAIHIPRSEITKKRLKNKKINKDDIIIVYCNTGQRARMASHKMFQLGYRNVFYIAGHYSSIQSN